MIIDKAAVEDRLEDFEKVCRKRGVKLTHQRLEIFREVAQTDDHPDAEKLYNRVKDRLHTISLDTVYRTLWLLNDLGLITTLWPERGGTRFDANLSRHHHFICIRCGMTRDFNGEELSALKLPDPVKYLGLVETTHIEARGVCNGCAGSDDEKKHNR